MKWLLDFLLGDSDVGKWSSCVDWRFLFSWLRWSIAVFMEGGIFAIKFVVSPGQEMKFPLFIAVMKVVGAGLKQAAWRNCASSIFVVFLCIITFNFSLILGIIVCSGRWFNFSEFSWVCWKRSALHLAGVFWGKVMSQRPSSRLRKPWSRIAFSLQTNNFFLVKTT